MIVADCNVLAYLVIPGDRTELAKRVFELDADWSAPILWRSEFSSVLATYVRVGTFGLTAAEQFMAAAEEVISVLPVVNAAEVLSRSAKSGCSSYDCEYVAAAEIQQVPLVTEDRKVLSAFPAVARSMEQFLQPHRASDA
jgi:predicted nucleic acid-binding protein